jgi:hypothetical protein
MWKINLRNHSRGKLMVAVSAYFSTRSDLEKLMEKAQFLNFVKASLLDRIKKTNETWSLSLSLLSLLLPQEL